MRESREGMRGGLWWGRRRERRREGMGVVRGKVEGKGGFQMIQLLDSDLGLCRLILIATSRIMSD